MGGASLNHFAKVLFILIFAVSFHRNSSLGINFRAEKASTEFIKTSCSTTNPSLCFTSLSVHTIAIQTSPRFLAQTALSDTLNAMVSTSNVMLRLSKGNNMMPREIRAMKDCLEVLANSIDELKRSMGEMNQLNGSPNYGIIAALTDDNTSMDGFAGKAGNTKNVVRGRILNVVHLTSNALALINNYSTIHG